MSNVAIALASREQISQIQPDRDKLLIHWGDGHCSSFHYIWLRDNCYCSSCGDPRRGEKSFHLLDLSLDIQPLSVDWDRQTLKIIWQPNGHESVYDGGWLRQHCYSAKERESRQHHPILWDTNSLRDIPKIAAESVIESDRGKLQLLEYLRDYGICLVQDLPPQKGHLESFTRLFGPTLETNYGRIFEIVADPEESKKSVANSTKALLPHTDDAYQNAPPGIIFFHCLMAGQEGSGQSIFVDGFRIAEALRQENLSAFELLCQYEVSFRKYYPDRIDMRSRFPIFRRDCSGNMREVRISNLFPAPLDLPEAAIVPFYRAYRQLMGLYTNPRFWLQYRLKPGDLMMFDNYRILHGRSAIALTHQRRHLRYCSVDRDYFHSLYRILTQKLHSQE